MRRNAVYPDLRVRKLLESSAGPAFEWFIGVGNGELGARRGAITKGA